MKTIKSLTISSIVLLLTICMFIGSTFAWFTDTATNSNNKVQAGKLDVSLHLYNGSTFDDISNDTNPIFNYDFWEPGYSTKKLLKVTNDGTLNIKYNLKLVSLNEDQTLYATTINPENNLRGYIWKADDNIDLESIYNALDPTYPHFSARFSDGINVYNDMLIFKTEIWYCVRDIETGSMNVTKAFENGHWNTEHNFNNIVFLKGCEDLQQNKLLANWIADNGTVEKVPTLLDVIDVYVKKDVTIADYNKAFNQIKTDPTFVKVGTLSELLDREIFVEDAPIVKANPSGSEKSNESLVEIILHMREDASNEYQGTKELFDIRVEATQYTKEIDGFNNDQYDKDSLYASDITDITGYTWTPDESKITSVEDINELFCMNGKLINTYFVNFQSNNHNFVYIDSYIFGEDFGYYYAYISGDKEQPLDIFYSKYEGNWLNKAYTTITFTSNITGIINGDTEITDVTPKMVSEFAKKLMKYGYLTKPSN